MENATEFLLKLFKSKWFWIGLVLVIVAFLIWRNWDKIKSRFGRVRGDFQAGGISDQRKGELEKLAEELHRENTDNKGDFVATCKLKNLNDTEIDYVARYYEDAITRGSSLYEHTDDRWGAMTDCDEDLMSILSRLGLK
jgi:hypothetical protein